MTWIGYGWFPFPNLPQGNGTAVEQQEGTTPTPPAAPAVKTDPPIRLCADCQVELDKNQATRCPACALDEQALLQLDAAYWDLFRVIRYGRVLNHSSEGQVYIRLIADTCKGALAYARRELELT